MTDMIQCEECEAEFDADKAEFDVGYDDRGYVNCPECGNAIHWSPPYYG